MISLIIFLFIILNLYLYHIFILWFVFVFLGSILQSISICKYFNNLISHKGFSGFVGTLFADVKRLIQRTREFFGYFKETNQFDIVVCKNISMLYYLFSFPGLLFRLSHEITCKTSGSRVWIPYEQIWALCFLVLCYWYASCDQHVRCMAASGELLIATFGYFTLLFLSKSDMQGRPVTRIVASMEKVGLKVVFGNQLIVFGAFASFYYGLSKSNHGSFSTELSIVDSVYFSFATAFTVGFGDIHPKSEFAKFVTSIEIILGFILNVIVLAIVITVWQRRNVAEPMIEGHPSSESKAIEKKA